MTSSEKEGTVTEALAEPGFTVWSRERARHFEWVAERMMPQPGGVPKRLIGAMRYSVLGGGKRIRPILCYAAGEVTGASATVLDRAALALEMIHSYSLVHDDMPSMDNDTLRRGRPTCHVQYGEALAMLAGDALQAEAFTVISSPEVPGMIAARLTHILARAAGVWGMCGGQALDLGMVGQHPDIPALSQMQAMKTGAMITASVLMGAQAGAWEAIGDGAKAGLARYGEALGVAFQVVDDILDCTQDSVTLGKTAGKDEKDDKPTWVSLLTLEGARKRARELEEEAIEALRLVTADPGAVPGCDRRLAEIARYVINRTH